MKAVCPIVVKEPGKVIVFKDLQFLNAEVFIIFRCFGKDKKVYVHSRL